MELVYFLHIWTLQVGLVWIIGLFIDKAMQMDKSQLLDLNMLPSLDLLPTLSSLIDSIEFTKKPKVKSTRSMSQTDSISSSQSIEVKEKSKVWTEEENELFAILLKKYGTDFHILSAFFPKKTKNQLKNRYKLYANMERKRERAQSNNLRAVSQLFKDVEEREERQERDEEWGM